MNLTRVTRSVGTSLWFVPVLCVVAGVVVSFVSIAIDRAGDYQLVPPVVTGGPDAALAILSSIATSMVTLTVLVLTITMVVVQLAMGQFSPRIVQTFLQDKPSQFAIGLFVATFAHAMLAMREVRFEEPVVVPGIAIVVAYALVVVSIAVLVLYVHHIGQSLRVASLLELVGHRTRRLMDELHPMPGVDERGAAHVVTATRSRVLNQLDDDRVVDVAERNRCTITLVPRFGDFVPAGAPLFESSAPLAEQSRDALRDCAVLGLERTLERDMAYGFRMLVDMAERSIAEGPLVDPTTAVQAIDRIYDLLRQLAPRPFPSGDRRSADGVVRLRIALPTWDDYVHLAFDELVLAGRGSPTVSQRMLDALDDLDRIAPTERRPVLREVRADLDRRTGVDGPGPASNGAIDLRSDPVRRSAAP